MAFESFLGAYADRATCPHICAAMGACVVARFFPFAVSVCGRHQIDLAAIVTGNIFFDDFERHVTILFPIPASYGCSVGISFRSPSVPIIYMS